MLERRKRLFAQIPENAVPVDVLLELLDIEF